MSALRCLAACALSLAVSGCVNLKVVRDFAGESARLSEYTELTTRFRDTYERERPYVSGEAERLAQANDRERKAAYRDLLAVHRTVARYMATLGTLAGDRTFDLSKNLDAAASDIKAHADFGLGPKQVDACSNLAKVVAKWLTSDRQEKTVRAMIREGDPPLQDLLEGMSALVEHYRRTDANERKSVLGLLEMELPFADTPKDHLLATLAKAHLQAKTREYELAEARYGEAERGLRSIREGHRKLVENAERLSSDEARAVIERFTKDIQTIRKNLQTLQ